MSRDNGFVQKHDIALECESSALKRRLRGALHNAWKSKSKSKENDSVATISASTRQRVGTRLMMNVNQERTMNAHCAFEMTPERHESAHVKLCERVVLGVVPGAIVCFECVGRSYRCLYFSRVKPGRENDK